MPHDSAGSKKGITPKQQAVLASLMEGMTLSDACKAADVPVGTEWNWRHENREGYNPEYRKAYDALYPLATDLLEREAFRRAYEGTDEPVFHEGVVCGYKRRYSDTLLIFLLKARRPEMYRERLDVTHDDAARKAVEEASDEELLEAADKLRAAVEARRGGDGG